ncbi:hypothetical protein BKA61DRAFT_574702 [Leptodontidium sp. MPI-SDFR-AT-0119]|nr:hypothetical protein BKA61DRAFT_574702 [Leptodontidium sp. MPI-SDFR-AT-0119]
MDSTSENRGSKYHFVIYTGASTTDPKARKLAKQDVMQHIRRNRTNPQVARRFSMPGLGAGRSDPFIKFPTELNSRSRELCLVFDERSGRASPLAVAWFQIGMLDAASFHQLLSGAATYFNNLRHGDGGQANGESLAHHAYSLQLVNNQMRKPGTATTDGVISSVVGFACYYVPLPIRKARNGG